MNTRELLKYSADKAYSELLESFKGVTEHQAWGKLPNNGADYLHTDGSIYGIVLHIASCRRAYASISFRKTEIRWRDCADEIERFEFSWPAAKDYLEKSHRYWMESWAHLEDLEQMVPTNYQSDWPAWKLIEMVSRHDSYHAGQIAMIRFGTGESAEHPESVAEDIRKYCAESKHW